MSKANLRKRFWEMRATILAYLRVIVRDPQLAEDLLQETFMVIDRRLDEFDEQRDATFESWVRTIAKNLARNALRKRSRLTYMPSDALTQVIDEAHDKAGSDEEQLVLARLVHLRDCLGRLPAMGRTLLELRFEQRLSFKAIGARLGRSSLAVQIAVSRLRQNLRLCIEKRGEEV